MCELRWGEFIDLPCGHAFCKGCLLQEAVTRFINGGAFSCPLCRSTAAHLVFEVDCATTPLPGIASHGIHRCLSLEDGWGNWHPYLVQNVSSEACFVHQKLIDGGAPRLPAFPRAQTIYLDPYHGWIVPNGVPANNSNFFVVDETTHVSTI